MPPPCCRPLELEHLSGLPQLVACDAYSHLLNFSLENLDADDVIGHTVRTNLSQLGGFNVRGTLGILYYYLTGWILFSTKVDPFRIALVTSMSAIYNIVCMYKCS
jgi:hypothetical protein